MLQVCSEFHITSLSCCIPLRIGSFCLYGLHTWKPRQHRRIRRIPRAGLSLLGAFHCFHVQSHMDGARKGKISCRPLCKTHAVKATNAGMFFRLLLLLQHWTKNFINAWICSLGRTSGSPCQAAADAFSRSFAKGVYVCIPLLMA